jgi:hypothetical protein
MAYVNSPYSHYLDLLGSWPTGIALASQWFVYFDFSSVNSLLGNLQNALSDREITTDWSLNPNVTKYLLDGRLQTSVQNYMGCVFCREVNLPSENIIAGHEGLEYGGYQAPAVSTNREKYQPLKLTMLETNASFLDLVIRPWIISVGYNGLIARPSKSDKYVKSNFVDVVMLAKTGTYKAMGIRKIYRYYNVAPVGMEGETYSYQEEGLKYTNVSFVYDNYAILDGDTGNLIGLP